MISFEIKCIQSFQKRYFVVLFYRIAPISHNSYGEWEQHFGIDRNLLTRPIILHMKLWNLACPENTQSLKSHAPQGYSHFLAKMKQRSTKIFFFYLNPIGCLIASKVHCTVVCRDCSRKKCFALKIILPNLQMSWKSVCFIKTVQILV